jgi:multiple sugar transport system substrate-binding protein
VSGTLSILGFGMPDEVATVRVDRFKELYPNVELNIPEGSLDQQQFLTAVASGNPPDLIYTNREVLSTYATRGALMPLEECVESMDIDVSVYRPAAVDQVTVDGTLYGIPEFFNIILVLIDDDVLAETGLTVEDIDTSDWDQIAAVNEQMTAVEDADADWF